MLEDTPLDTLRTKELEEEDQDLGLPLKSSSHLSIVCLFLFLFFIINILGLVRFKYLPLSFVGPAKDPCSARGHGTWCC